MIAVFLRNPVQPVEFRDDRPLHFKPAASIHEDEAVVLVIRAAVFAVFQLEVAFLKLHLI